MRVSFARVVPASLLTLVLAGAGCGKAASEPAGQPAPASQNTALEVVNRSSSDMDIFLVQRGGQRTRLGLAPGGQTTKFELLPTQVAGAGSVVFEARPLIGSAGRPAQSEPTVLLPGDVIKLDIPPN